MELHFIGTCSDKEVAEISLKSGKRFSYKKACKLIKEQYFDIYHALALDYYNPWSRNTKIITYNKREYLHIEHSAIDYLFQIM
jgi:hypothetical protein